MHAGQPARAPGPGIDTDGVPIRNGQSRLLGVVTADHDLPGLMPGRIVVVFPIEHELRLFLEWNVGIGVGMHEEVCRSFKVGQKLMLDKFPVRIGNVG